MQTPPFAGRVIGAIDRFLNVASCFFQNFAHLAGHVRRVFFFIADQYLTYPKQNLCAPGRGSSPPAIERGRGRRDGGADIVAD